MGLPPEREPVLLQAPRGHRDRPGRQVVVVEARVVVVHPADEPDGEVGVAQELLVDAPFAVVADVRRPQLGAGGEGADERLELVALEVAAVRAHDRAGSWPGWRSWILLGSGNVGAAGRQGRQRLTDIAGRVRAARGGRDPPARAGGT